MGKIVTTVAPREPGPAPEIDRIVSRIRSAADQTGDRLSISNRSALSDGERSALTLRADELRVGFTPAEAVEIAETVLRLMAGYPSLRLTHEEAARTVAAFVEALSGLPLWAIRKACHNWATGKTQGSNPAFPPSAPELRIAADAVARPTKQEAGSIQAVLGARVDAAPTDDERATAVAHWYENVRPALQHADVSDTLSPEQNRAEHIEANERVRQRERQAAGANPNVPRTLAMDQNLARIRADQEAADRAAASERSTTDAER